jgi:hypothetical protein
MSGLAKLLLGMVFAVFLALPYPGITAPPIRFSADDYRALADVDSAATIPPGTRITTANWRLYKQFMPIWMRAAYEGQYHWQVEPGKPEYDVVVAPATHYPMPAKFVEDTAKYGGQARLERIPSGGYTWRGYVAGLVFPDLKEPNLGIKILYNSWAGFSPMIVHWTSEGWSIDKYGNVGESRANGTSYRLAHLSEPGEPVNLPFANGVFGSGRLMVDSPEQVKYLTELTLQYDDPTRMPEVYAFLPSLRRALRLSTAAHCAPVLGSDFVQDDGNWLPSNYDVSLLGKKKVLMPMADPAKAYDPNSYVEKGGFPGWMKPTAGKWELRNFYVLDMQWIQSRGSFCYSHRVVYIDYEIWTRPVMGDFYDRDGKFWKANFSVVVPIDFRGQHTLIFPASVGALMGLDFQNGHESKTVNAPFTIDEAVPAEYKDIEEMSNPGGLALIMK